MKKCLLICFLFLVPLLAICQDTIVLKTGDRIVCRITKLDSSQVYFDINRNNTSIHSSVNKNSVEALRYYLNTGPVMIAPGNIFINRRFNLLAITAGGSFAVGEFANKDADNDKAGFGGSGLFLSLTSINNFSKILGFAIKGYYATNTFKAENLAKAQNIINNGTVTYNSVNYKSGGVLAGLAATLPVDNFSFYGEVLGGYGGLWEPEVSFFVVTAQSSGWVSLGKVDAGSFVYNITGGMSVVISNNWELFLDADFLHGNYKFGNMTVSFSNANSTSVDRGTQPYSIICISAGIGFKF
jgi:hypothetical protein